MTSNFKVDKNNIEIHYHNWTFDLHNVYNFRGFQFDSSERILTLDWYGSGCEWDPVDQPLEIKIKIYKVEYFIVLPRDHELPFTEDSCLSSLTYFLSSERGIDE